ncbi:Transmembrane protein [Fasciola hepatica]|uniref:Transmembrane protein n=1 Tax=Fasciola hepatica TaxID=6192 RepID=A0A2H1BT25_FASHE|nr:Transmembrane protein [Fasciola hepatica]
MPNNVLGFRWQVLPVMVLQVVLYAVSFIPNSYVYLAITPGRLFVPNFWMWTLATFSFFSHSILLLFSDLVTMFLLESFLSVYSWKELLLFCTFVNVVTGLITVALMFVEYAVTFDTELLFSEKICGLLALLGGITVVGRQMMGDKLLFDFPLGKIRQKHIPFMCVLVAIALAVTKVVGQVSFCMFIGGIFVAWIYLRFVQKHSNGVRGDTTETFTFSGFFPNHLEPPVAIVSNAIYSGLVKLRICTAEVSKSSNKKLSVPVMPFMVNVREALPSENKV